MRKRCGWLIVALMLVMAGCLRAENPAAPAAEGKTIRLLTVGNSFADNALTYLPQIVEASGNKLIAMRANVGGCSLQRHWSFVEKYEANHEDPAGRPYGKNKQSLEQMLAKQPWDVVTIQQYSLISHDVTTYRPYAQELYDYIHKRVPGAKVLIQQTWAYRVDDPRFKEQKDDGQPHTQQAMYEQVRSAYHTIAKELNTGIIPSGDAMQLGHTDPVWGYKPDPAFDASKATEGQLPDQSRSLHGGWYWKKQKDGTVKLNMDGHHANRAGQYLIACVWFETLYDQSVVDNAYVPEGLDADFAKFLRATAHKAVADLKAEQAAQAANK